MELTRGKLLVEHHRVGYDVAKAAAAARERGLPEHFAQMILQARSLDAILQAEQAEMPATPAERRGKAGAPRGRIAQEMAILTSVIRLAEESHYEAPHTKKVTGLALRLFDELTSLHRLRRQKRFWLQCAGLLHDIGWVAGRKAHHKTALKLILESPLLPFTDRERLIVGGVARDHRKALPSEQHAHFAALDPDERRIVSLLGGILRVADGLDVTHQSILKNLTCDIGPAEVILRLQAGQRSEPERQKALAKGKLFEIAFDRKLIIEWQSAPTS
jgi:exopolyphosphatase/guanosine-5'-triphosphate,3'-diphosphate pyrophosphatase